MPNLIKNGLFFSSLAICMHPKDKQHTYKLKMTKQTKN